MPITPVVSDVKSMSVNVGAVSMVCAAVTSASESTRTMVTVHPRGVDIFTLMWSLHNLAFIFTISEYISILNLKIESQYHAGE